MNEFEVIIDETLDSLFEDADSKEAYDQIVEACKNALKTAKERRKEFIADNEEDDDFDDYEDDEE